jgi:hypothetical protein
VYLQINTVKYDTDQEITNTYENLQIVRTQFFTDKLIFIYILKFLENLNSHLIFEFKGKKKILQLPRPT